MVLRTQHTTEDFILLSRKVHGNRYGYSKSYYVNNKTLIVIICESHGEFTQIPKHHMRGIGCYRCGIIKRAATKTKLSEQFKIEAHIIHHNKYDYSKSIYINNKTKLEIVCSTHGSFWQKPNTHLSLARGCKKCSNNISNKCRAWLASLDIPDDREHREVLIRVGTRRFYADGFDSKTNTIYEFLGDYFHGNPKKYKARSKNKLNKKTFGRLYKEWLEKETLLKEAGYNIICIWENDYDTSK